MNQLEQVMGSTINEIYQTKKFNVATFYNRMESAFNQLGYREKSKGGVENILVMRLDAIGDFILTSGFIRELRANYPSAHITLVVSEIVYPLAQLCPYVNEVLPFNNKYNPDDIPTILQRIFELARNHLWKRHFSMSFVVEYMSYKFPIMFMSYISGACERIGYGFDVADIYRSDSYTPNPLNKLFLTRPIVNPKNIISEAQRHLYVLSAIGLRINRTDMELWFDSADFFNARQLLSKIEPQKMKIIVGIGAAADNRKYPIKQYIEALKNIIKRRRGGKLHNSWRQF